MQSVGHVLYVVIARCYNCGEFANHIAAKCPQVRQPKRCHHCKSEEHLIADCPHRPTRPPPGPPSHQSDPSTSSPDAAAAAVADAGTSDISSKPKNDVSWLPLSHWLVNGQSARQRLTAILISCIRTMDRVELASELDWRKSTSQ